MRTIIAVSLVLAISGCAIIGRGGPPSPVGRYEITTQVDGQPMTASVTIRENEDGSYGGTIVSPILPTLQIAELTWLEESQSWYVRAPGPDAPLEIFMTIDGEEVTGGWSYGVDLGDFAGVRLSRDQ